MARLYLTAYGLKNDISYNFIDKKIFKMFIGTGILLNYTTATARSYDLVTFENFRRSYDLPTAGINALAGFAIIPSKGAIKYEFMLINSSFTFQYGFSEIAFLQLRIHYKF